jgi:hypothetical protein
MLVLVPNGGDDETRGLVIDDGFACGESSNCLVMAADGSAVRETHPDRSWT